MVFFLLKTQQVEETMQHWPVVIEDIICYDKHICEYLLSNFQTTTQGHSDLRQTVIGSMKLL